MSAVVEVTAMGISLIVARKRAGLIRGKGLPVDVSSASE
jgi:hypothetical protein